MSWWSSLFGKSNIVDKISDSIDAIVLTDEEKIKYNAQRFDNFLKLEEEVNKQSMPRALTRRWIALPIAYTGVGMAIATFVLCCIYAENPADAALKMFELFTIPFFSVAAFYFGDHWLDKFAKMKK